MRISQTMLAVAAFAAAAVLATLVAIGAALVIENRSAAAVTSRLLADGMTWASVETDGLQVHLTGTAPNEAARFRAVNLAGSVLDAARVRDALEVTPVRAIQAPRFSVEMLRNDDGIQLIGLMPDTKDQPDIAAEAALLGQGVQITDMIETAAFPAPENWNAALEFGIEALKLLPRSKISVAADRVSITAISDSESERRRLESELAGMTPDGISLATDISAPRPVLTPFTLRFVKDEQGARFDACSADTDRARDRILSAAFAAGVEGKTPCTVGLGVPTPRWAEAAEAGLKAVSDLGAGSITFSDADVTLLATDTTPQATFDKVVGELQTALPEVFSLKSTLPPKKTATLEGPAEFTATLAEDGRVELRGRLTDDVLRRAVDSYSRAQFGGESVYLATRFDPELPDGWAVRVLAGLESLAQLENGALTVRADTVEISGVAGSQSARGRIAQVLSDKLGQGKTFKVSVVYDERLDPLAEAPTADECMAEINAALTKQKISFTPSSAEIDSKANPTLDALTETLGRCPGMKLEIAGHTDAQGSGGGNLALSQARAEAVLVSLQGRRVDVSGLTAKGYGEERPLADNGTDAGREANRRIEFILIDAGDQLKIVNSAPDTPPTDTADQPAQDDATAPASDGTSPDFSADASPSVAPPEQTQRPEPRPTKP